MRAFILNFQLGTLVSEADLAPTAPWRLFCRALKQQAVGSWQLAAWFAQDKKGAGDSYEILHLPHTKVVGVSGDWKINTAVDTGRMYLKKWAEDEIFRLHNDR